MMLAVIPLNIKSNPNTTESDMVSTKSALTITPTAIKFLQCPTIFSSGVLVHNVHVSFPDQCCQELSPVPKQPYPSSTFNSFTSSISCPSYAHKAYHPGIFPHYELISLLLFLLHHHPSHCINDSAPISHISAHRITIPS